MPNFYFYGQLLQNSHSSYDEVAFNAKTSEARGCEFKSPRPTKIYGDKRLSGFVNLFLFVLLTLILVPVDSAEAETNAYYKVVSGDNLTHIAKRFGITLKDLRKANNLKSDMLSIDQKLVIQHPFKKSSKSKIKWKNPCPKAGPVVNKFGQYKSKNILMARTGEDRACPVGSPVYSPSIAVVKHIGQLDGFGTVIILAHKGSYATVYSPMNPESLAVSVGQAINAGQLLGRTGQPVTQDSSPYIHIELRKNEIAIDPKTLR